jgi:hypothetical protein
MRNPGLEPGSLAALEPESSASANSASSAGNYLYSQFLIFAYFFTFVKCKKARFKRQSISFYFYLFIAVGNKTSTQRDFQAYCPLPIAY